MGTKSYCRGEQGFTLIELMIVVVIIGILAAIVVPSYNQYILKANRSDAIAALNQMLLDQEKFRANNVTYSSAPTTDLGWSAADVARTYYDITVTGATAVGFTAVATAKGKQVDDTQGGVSCTPLTIVVAPTGQTRTPAECW